MDLSRIYVCFLIVFLGVFVLEKVLPCELPSGKKTECGKHVSSQNQCPKTCCFDTTSLPDCYFDENVYGPIRHSNGLCISVKDGSTLFWSNDCTSRNTFFVVSYDHPPYHIASGECVLSDSPAEEKDGKQLILRSDGTYCNTRNFVTYRPTENGTLEYHYLEKNYHFCIGDKNPKINDYVYMSKKACQHDNICQNALSYVYQKKYELRMWRTIQCYLGQTIKIVIVTGADSISWGTTCVSTKATQLIQNKCDEKQTCNFYIYKDDLGSCYRNSNTFFVRYTCEVDAKPAAPRSVHVSAKSKNKLLIGWSNDASKKYDVEIKFQICYLQSQATISPVCSIVSSSGPSVTTTFSNLKPATKYDLTVARYSCDGRILGSKKSRSGITRSTALKASGKRSATSFQIQLGALQEDDKYVQIVVWKLQNDTTPSHYPENNLRQYDVNNTVDSKPYITAELTSSYVRQNSLFTIGDGRTYVGSDTRKRRSIDFLNVKLESDTYYSVLQRTFKSSDLYYDSDWMDVIKTDTASSIPLTNKPAVTKEATIRQSGGGKDSSNDNASNGGGSGFSTAIIGAAAAGGVFLLIILVIFVIIFIRQRRRENKGNDTHFYEKPVKYKTSKNKEAVNVEPVQENNPPSSGNRDENPNVFTAPSGDVYAKPIKNRSKSEHENYANIQADTLANGDEIDGVKLSRLLFYVEEMKKNDNFGFKKEFKELPVGQTHPWLESRKAENVNKNKYKNFAAYDHSRVVLSGGGYINANFVKGISESEEYIAAQGPVEETVNDFWQMIWEQDSTCIIALTNLIELGKVKCFKYWPDGEASFGEIHVKAVKEQLFADYVLRYFDIKKDGKGKKITQYHFISWPDHGVPKYPTKLLAFRHRFRALHTRSLQAEGSQPIVVHCSAGIGRTGTFIALDMTLLRLNQLDQQTININETIKELRNQRINMVQTLEQYIFLHDAVLETVLCGFTEIVAENLKTEIERLEQKELKKSFTGFEIEFNKLSSVCPPFAPDECVAALRQKNKSKNRDSKIYPTENLRVYLSGRKEDEDPYINATYVHSYSQARAYIATQAPLSNTINDFWQMVFEKRTVVIVMLNSISEEKTIYPKYWPDDMNQEQEYGVLFVKMVSEEIRGPISSRKFVITNKNPKAAVTEHTFRHVQFTDWPEHGIPGSHIDVMNFLDSVEEAQQHSANGAVIVHCSNGAHRTGAYLTLAIQRERVKSEHVVDIFRCVKMLREQRPQFVGNLAQYKFCYDAMLTFVGSFTTYDNIPKVQKD